MLDKHGYAELVIHPPPLNFFTLGLLPFIFRKSWMKKAADSFSKLMFWMENMCYIFALVMYELVLCPFIYLKVVYNVIVLSRIWIMLPLILFWLVVGPFVLLYSISKDLFYYVKILCAYHDEEDSFKEKEEEEFK